jgi:hypothetical protein|tara:strand:- start:459 stop:563 length:105 start_codon:yes stop_codon:yes gene_type:complete
MNTPNKLEKSIIDGKMLFKKGKMESNQLILIERI